MFLPRNFGGLAIRDPKIMNLDFDMNIVWCLLSYSKEWLNFSFVHKYFHKNRLIGPKNKAWLDQGLNIWRLCKVAASIMMEDFS